MIVIMRIAGKKSPLFAEFTLAKPAWYRNIDMCITIHSDGAQVNVHSGTDTWKWYCRYYSQSYWMILPNRIRFTSPVIMWICTVRLMTWHRWYCDSFGWTLLQTFCFYSVADTETKLGRRTGKEMKFNSCSKINDWNSRVFSILGCNRRKMFGTSFE